MKPDLLILTNTFPNSPLTSESWLADEIRYSQSLFTTITLLPETHSEKHILLPDNCKVLTVNTKNTKLTFKELLNCFYILFTDFSEYPSKLNYFKAFRHNLALLKNLSLKAKYISQQLSVSNVHLIVYAYWADNLLTTACILKQQFKNCSIVSRAHGFEVFEEQTKYNVIPFRKFQSKFATKIFADSKNGYKHLLKKKSNLNIYSSSYVGTINHGIGIFSDSDPFTIVTCSHIRNVKRLHLMADVLKFISFPLVWYVIGTGDDLELLKQCNSKLQAQITINYLGNLSNGEVMAFYKTHHLNLFVSLSYSEGLPVSMMEAQSFGIPIMSTNVGGCNEICNDETGLLIPKDFEPLGVAGQMLQFKNSEKNSLKFRQQCRNYWDKNFNAEKNYTHFSKEIAAL